MQRVSAVSSEKYRQESHQSTDEECEAILSSALKMPNIELMKINLDDINLNHPTSNQIFHYTRCTTPKRVTSLRGPSPRHCARATQLLSKKCRSGGEPLATLCPI